MYAYISQEKEKRVKLEIFVGIKTRELAFYHVPVIAGKDVHTKIVVYSSYRISMVHPTLSRMSNTHHRLWIKNI
jgi:hypothetical protein